MKLGGLEIATLGIFFLAVCLVIILNLTYGPRITIEKIPMQWGIDGNPTWYANKVIGLWWFLYFLLALGIGMIVLGLFGGAGNTIWYTVIFISILMPAVQWWHLNAVIRWIAKQ